MKIKEFQKELKKKNIDLALLYNIDSININANFRYFSGYNGLGTLVIPSIKKPFLLVPKMEYERAKKISIIKQVYLFDKKKFFESVNNSLKRKKIKHKIIGIDKSSFTLDAYKTARSSIKGRYKDISKICSLLRSVKTEEEIRITKKACRLTDSILNHLFKKIKYIKTESEAAAFLEYESKKGGCEITFKPIVASGKNSSQPHYEPKNTKLKRGFCIIDFGIRYKGYCSDITRTIFLGNPAKKEVFLYNYLLSAQKSIIRNLAIDKKCKDLYNQSLKEIEKYKKYFIHGLGHGIGVELHELPNITENSTDTLKENMVFTIEPGLYFPNKFGIRIEDDILLTKKGPNILTKTKKDLIVIKK